MHIFPDGPLKKVSPVWNDSRPRSRSPPNLGRKKCIVSESMSINGLDNVELAIFHGSDEMNDHLSKEDIKHLVVPPDDATYESDDTVILGSDSEIENDPSDPL